MDNTDRNRVWIDGFCYVSVGLLSAYMTGAAALTDKDLSTITWLAWTLLGSSVALGGLNAFKAYRNTSYKKVIIEEEKIIEKEKEIEKKEEKAAEKVAEKIAE